MYCKVCKTERATLVVNFLTYNFFMCEPCFKQKNFIHVYEIGLAHTEIIQPTLKTKSDKFFNV